MTTASASTSPQRTIAIVQARLGSERLPGKVLHDIGGQPMLNRVISRLRRCSSLDDIVVATTDNPADRPLVKYCHQQAWNCFVGSEHDVLDRYLQSAQKFSADRIVRITADCPLIDPNVVDATVATALANPQADYVCNFHPARRLPRGLDCETLTRVTLERLHTLTELGMANFDAAYREHVTLFLYRHENEFTTLSAKESILEPGEDWSHLRWTVDTPADLELVRTIFRYFAAQQPTDDFGWREVLQAYRSHPEWLEINNTILQKVA